MILGNTLINFALHVTRLRAILRLKEIINRILWSHPDRLDEYLLVIIDRVSELGFRYIGLDLVKHVDNNYLYIRKDSDEIVIIPLHRVIRIEKKNGEIIWQRGNK